MSLFLPNVAVVVVNIVATLVVGIAVFALIEDTGVVHVHVVVVVLVVVGGGGGVEASDNDDDDDDDGDDDNCDDGDDDDGDDDSATIATTIHTITCFAICS